MPVKTIVIEDGNVVSKRIKFGPQAMSDRRPFIPQQPTCGDCNDMSVLCRLCCKSRKLHQSEFLVKL